jgi:hypothetical protein
VLVARWLTNEAVNLAIATADADHETAHKPI